MLKNIIVLSYLSVVLTFHIIEITLLAQNKNVNKKKNKSVYQLRESVCQLRENEEQ